MGQALQEETQYHEGLPLRANLLDYRIPTIAESPPIDVHLVESSDPLGPFGAKEASEGALHGFPPALTNAIADAHRRAARRAAGHARPGARCDAARSVAPTPHRHRRGARARGD